MSEIKITKENFEAEVLKSDVPVVVDFWASWCGPCKMLAPEIEALAEEGIAKVGKINVDEEGELAIKFGIMSIPTVILFRDGQIDKKTVGYMTKDQLKAELGL
ncbi:MAG: thioredoxin [Clostridia bacterium]|nr:thioredoxin [Clostridia bacterium]